MDEVEPFKTNLFVNVHSRIPAIYVVYWGVVGLDEVPD